MEYALPPSSWYFTFVGATRPARDGQPPEAKKRRAWLGASAKGRCVRGLRPRMSAEGEVQGQPHVQVTTVRFVLPWAHDVIRN